MERLRNIKDQLLSQIEGQMGNLQCVNTKELGEVVDMVKDLSEAIYYCTVVKAMEEKDENVRSYYYTEKYYPIEPETKRMYYPATRYSHNSQDYREEPYPMIHDIREGKAGLSRKTYMESKATHQDSVKKIQDLEHYLQELTNDITEMISDASPEEKAVMSKKLTMLASKIPSAGN